MSSHCYSSCSSTDHLLHFHHPSEALESNYDTNHLFLCPTCCFTRLVSFKHRDCSRLFIVALMNLRIANFIVANWRIGHCFLVFVSVSSQFRGASYKMEVAELKFLKGIHLGTNLITKSSTTLNLWVLPVPNACNAPTQPQSLSIVSTSYPSPLSPHSFTFRFSFSHSSLCPLPPSHSTPLSHSPLPRSLCTWTPPPSALSAPETTWAGPSPSRQPLGCWGFGWLGPSGCTGRSSAAARVSTQRGATRRWIRCVWAAPWVWSSRRGGSCYAQSTCPGRWFLITVC